MRDDDDKDRGTEADYIEDMKLAAAMSIYGHCERCEVAPVNPTRRVADIFQDHYLGVCDYCADHLEELQAKAEPE